eukprot:GSA120T00007881001.1
MPASPPEKDKHLAQEAAACPAQDPPAGSLGKMTTSPPASSSRNGGTSFSPPKRENKPAPAEKISPLSEILEEIGIPEEERSNGASREQADLNATQNENDDPSQQQQPLGAPVRRKAPPMSQGDSEPWVDFTDFLTDEVAKTLKTGDMVYSKDFCLVDGMSAVVSMDPKMDSGFRTKEEVNTLQKARKFFLGEGKNKKSFFNTLEELNQTLDALLNEFLIWAGGGRLWLQTIGTCVLLFDNEFFEELKEASTSARGSSTSSLFPTTEAKYCAQLFANFVYELLSSCLAVQNVIKTGELYDGEEEMVLLEEPLILECIARARRPLFAAKIPEARNPAESATSSSRLYERFPGEPSGFASVEEDRITPWIAAASSTEEAKSAYTDRLRFLKQYRKLLNLRVHVGVKDAVKLVESRRNDESKDNKIMNADENLQSGELQLTSASTTTGGAIESTDPAPEETGEISQEPEEQLSAAAKKNRNKRKKKQLLKQEQTFSPTKEFLEKAQGGYSSSPDEKPDPKKFPIAAEMDRRRTEFMEITNELLALVTDKLSSGSGTASCSSPTGGEGSASTLFPTISSARWMLQDYHHRAMRVGPPRKACVRTMAESWAVWEQHLKSMLVVYTKYHDLLFQTFNVKGQEYSASIIVPILRFFMQMETVLDTGSLLGKTGSNSSAASPLLAAAAASTTSSSSSSVPKSSTAEAKHIIPLIPNHADVIARSLAWCYFQARTDYRFWASFDPERWDEKMLDKNGENEMEKIANQPPVERVPSMKNRNLANAEAAEMKSAILAAQNGSSTKKTFKLDPKTDLQKVVLVSLRTFLHHFCIQQGYGAASDIRRKLNAGENIELSSCESVTKLRIPENFQLETTYDEMIWRLDEICRWNVRILHQTTAKRHRQFVHLWGELGHFQEEFAQVADFGFRICYGNSLRLTAPIQYFVTELGYQAIIQHMLLGFPLECYDNEDLLIIFWFLDFVCECRGQVLRVRKERQLICSNKDLVAACREQAALGESCEEGKDLTSEEHQTTQELQAGATSNNSKKKKKKKKPGAEVGGENNSQLVAATETTPTTPPQIDGILLYHAAEGLLLKALFRLVYFLAVKQITKRDNFSASWNRYWYRLRMVSSTGAFPQSGGPPPFKEYWQMVASVDKLSANFDQELMLSLFLGGQATLPGGQDGGPALPSRASRPSDSGEFPGCHEVEGPAGRRQAQGDVLKRAPLQDTLAEPEARIRMIDLGRSVTLAYDSWTKMRERIESFSSSK